MADDETDEQTQESSQQTTEGDADHSPEAAQIGTSDGDGESS